MLQALSCVSPKGDLDLQLQGATMLTLLGAPCDSFFPSVLSQDTFPPFAEDRIIQQLTQTLLLGGDVLYSSKISWL